MILPHGGAECGGELNRSVQGLARRAIGEPLAECLALHILHRHVVLAVACLPQRVNVSDVRMAQRRRGPGFLLEAENAIGIASEISGQELESHLAPKPQLRGKPHFRHHTRTEGAHHLVWAEPRAAAEGHGMRRIIRRLHESQLESQDVVEFD
jgi:hypothetical protein